MDAIWEMIVIIINDSMNEWLKLGRLDHTKCDHIAN